MSCDLVDSFLVSLIVTMRSLGFLVCLAVRVAAQTGTAEGFAKGVTGGGTVAAVTPTTNAELVSYLGKFTDFSLWLSRHD